MESTELDTTNISETLNVVGITTVQSLLDVNGGLQANTAIIEDLTDNRVVISGPGGELEDDANLTFDGSELSVGVNLNVTGVSTFSNDVSVNAKLKLPDGSVSANYAGFGDADDLKIFHNGTHSIVRETGTEVFTFKVTTTLSLVRIAAQKQW